MLIVLSIKDKELITSYCKREINMQRGVSFRANKRLTLSLFFEANIKNTKTCLSFTKSSPNADLAK